MTAALADLTTIDLHGQALDISARGSGKGVGRDILFLSSGIWFAPDNAFVDDLAMHGRVTTPVHPGFGATPIPHHLTSADDLAYLYLDLIERMVSTSKGSRDVVIVAGSFGAFVAAQMAIKSCQRIAGLVLIGPTGVKAGGRTDRDYVDLFAHTEAALADLTFADPEPHRFDPTKAPEEAVLARVRAREALARYAWQPYMHDPKLAGRLLRIGAPTLVLQGAQDKIVARACAELYATKIPGARLHVIEHAGHLPHVEQPAATLAAIASFLTTLPNSK